MLKNKFSRRNALSLLGASGAATVVLVGTQTQAKAENKHKIVDAWLNAFYTAKDPDALAEFYTSDGIFEDIPGGIQIQGPDNIKCFVKTSLNLFSNFKVELISTFIGRNKAVAEYFLTATNTGLYPSTPSNNTFGKIFRIRTATVFDLNGNKIERSSDYYDNGGILVQLGLIDAPPLPPAPSCS